MPIVISVIFFVIYYIISISGEKLAKEGTWSSLLGMWISAIILTPLALYLSKTANNDSPLLDVDWYIGRIKRLQDKIMAKLPQHWKEWIEKKENSIAEKIKAQRANRLARKAKKSNR